jgi:hypothetical protein
MLHSATDLVNRVKKNAKSRHPQVADCLFPPYLIGMKVS